MKGFIEYLKDSSIFEDQILHHEFIPPAEASFDSLKTPLSPQVNSILKGMGIEGLYSHQAEAIERIRSGENVAVVTPTASGKSLIYNLPVFESVIQDPTVRVLYLFPLKALEQDQLKVLNQWNRHLPSSRKVKASIYDGDTSDYKRKKIRENPPNILITNPDMLHYALLPFHPQWRDWFRHLRYIVVDELHTYKGIFGSNILHVLRRLMRVCRFYGSSPQFILSSATIANPAEFARKLTGVECSIVEKNGAPRAGRHFLFLNPKGSPYRLACLLLKESMRAGFKTIAFTQARKITELIHAWLIEDAPELACRVSSYRAGYLQKERREIEARLASGQLDAVVSTSALEMGIDIGGLDVCILVGYPGTINRTWQRGGRVGRSERESLIVLVAQPDALDQYFMRHPSHFFKRGFEKAVVDPKNRVVLKNHLVCAAAEVPLRGKTDFMLSDLEEDEGKAVLQELEAELRLQRSESGREWFSATLRPQAEIDLRSAGEGYSIIREDSGRLVGGISGPRTFWECHPGAIYLHKAQQYKVTGMDHAGKNVYVRPVEVGYYTRALSEKETEILSRRSHRKVGTFRSWLGELRVRERVTGYEKRSIFGQELLSTHPLEMPELVFETVGLWMEIPDEIKAEIHGRQRHFMGALHALEHALISIFPLIAICERDDVGGISFPLHPQVGRGAIFIYDGYPGGVGLAEAAYEEMETLLESALGLVQNCPCEKGCPSCIHSPKCGSGNKPLDKQGCLDLLMFMLGRIPFERTSRDRQGEGDFPGDHHVSPSNDRPLIVPTGTLLKRPNMRFFDLETQRSAEDVGGWMNKHLMRLSVGVVYDEKTGELIVFDEQGVHKLIELLQESELVVGFNVKRFDYEVLRGYGDFDISAIPTFDIMEDLFNKMGFRLSLDHLAEMTLGRKKTADGLQAVEWFKTGQREKLVEYCKQDVLITRDLFNFGRERSFVIYRNRRDQRVRIPVDWALEKILSEQR